MRIAQIIDTRTEDPNLKDKIKQAMDATRKTEDEVCTALHDCDNDLDRAVNMLLEGMGQVCKLLVLCAGRCHRNHIFVLIAFRTKQRAVTCFLKF
jgi:hypothetical protein